MVYAEVESRTMKRMRLDLDHNTSASPPPLRQLPQQMSGTLTMGSKSREAAEPLSRFGTMPTQVSQLLQASKMLQQAEGLKRMGETIDLSHIIHSQVIEPTSSHTPSIVESLRAGEAGKLMEYNNFKKTGMGSTKSMASSSPAPASGGMFDALAQVLPPNYEEDPNPLEPKRLPEVMPVAPAPAAPRRSRPEADYANLTVGNAGASVHALLLQLLQGSRTPSSTNTTYLEPGHSTSV